VLAWDREHAAEEGNVESFAAAAARRGETR
jgi:hypothetical protein